MIHPFCFIGALGAAVLASGCASSAAKPPLVIDRVGPTVLEKIVPKREGTLVVYSDWRTISGYGEGDSNVWHHDDYKILQPDGVLYRKVDNAPYAGVADPAEVSLPPGDYLIDAFASRYGHVQIPVHIEAFRATTVCLTGEFDERFKKMPLVADALVKLPDGRVVGWRSP